MPECGEQNTININRFDVQVCAALGTSLGLYLDSEAIHLPIHYGQALRKLKSVVPDIDTMAEDDPRRPAADRALIYATAVCLVPYYRQQVMRIEQTPSAKTERFEMDWGELLDRLKGEVEEALCQLSPEYAGDTGSTFTGFRLTFGR
ncbi:MAG: hypothetical protein GXY32_06575 [Ruminococcaceae bacterium]|nr:hypothetical protein [Oscillospiraceae bacterium]